MDKTIEINLGLKGTPVELYRFMIDISYAIEAIRDDKSVSNKEDRMMKLNLFKESIKAKIEEAGYDLNELAAHNYELIKAGK